MKIKTALNRCMISTCILFLTSNTVLMAQEPDSSSALFQVLESERNFSREAAKYGIKTAFIKYIADESIAYRGKRWITNNKEFWKNSKDVPYILKWEPEFVDIAKSGDFGISTGPWELQEYRPYTKPIGSGYYISVWEKQNDNNWRVIYDQGSETPLINNYDHSVNFPEGADQIYQNVMKVNIDSISIAIKTLDEQFLSEWIQNPSQDLYLSYLSPNVRLQRMGHLPSTNKDTIESWIDELDKKLSWKVSGSKTASSDDIGFTYGYLLLQDNPNNNIGHYARFWKKQPDGSWRIYIDLINLD